TLHHIVSDGWSMDVLVRESAALYAAFCAGKPSPLPELAVQYADYAVWQRGWLRDAALEAQLSWWREHLAGAPPVLEVPTDFPRPAVQSLRGARNSRVLPRALADALHALCRREGTTLFMALLAGFEVVLSRYSRQEDFVVGTDIANRNRAETEGLIGFFINQLALRARLDGDPPFRELLGRVRQTTLDAYAHQDLPFEELVKALNPGRGQGHAPLFQVKLVLQNQPATALEVPGLTLRGEEVDAGTSRLDLTLSIVETARGLECSCEYRTDLFETATIDRLVRHLGTVLEAAAARPESRLSTLPLLSEDEARQLTGWNDTRVEYPRGDCLHSLFEAQVRRTPNAVALESEGSSLTYAQLDARANQLAWHLLSQGVGPESLVGVCMERSLEMVVALLGSLKAGAAYVPIDPGYPAERLAFMLADSAPRVLLTQLHLLPGLPPSAAPVLCLDSQWPTVATQPTTSPKARTTPRSLAYVIYTSGSTGRPKGAMNEHGAVSNRLHWMQQAYSLGPADAVLQKTPFSFDVSVWEFFWPLMTGARLVVARPGGHQDPTYLAGVIASQRITTLHFVPSMLRAFLDEPGLEAACASVRRIICSGEALPADLARQCLERLPGAGLHNLYGPTEAAVDVTAWQCQPGDVRASVPIGRPIANTRIHLLDAALHAVPVGVPGELFIAGVQVGRGYLSRPELTAERFVPDPFSTTPGARMYRTGDLARWLPDGTVDYLGRLDFQVK
ncbi:non-ribosomal peptide synthetase, partial [Pyxidicoccus sp. 3LG]